MAQDSVVVRAARAQHGHADRVLTNGRHIDLAGWRPVHLHQIGPRRDLVMPTQPEPGYLTRRAAVEVQTLRRVQTVAREQPAGAPPVGQRHAAFVGADRAHALRDDVDLQTPDPLRNRPGQLGAADPEPSTPAEPVLDGQRSVEVSNPGEWAPRWVYAEPVQGEHSTGIRPSPHACPRERAWLVDHRPTARRAGPRSPRPIQSVPRR